MGMESRKWDDETAGMSGIDDRLLFLGDRHWKNCTVIMDSMHKLQELTTELSKNGKRLASKSAKGEEWNTQYVYPIDDTTCVNVRGYLKNIANITGAKGQVTVNCEFDDNSILKYESASYADETAGNSLIKDLYLPASHKWEKCSITISFRENHTTGCMVTLLKDGQLAHLPDHSLPGWHETQRKDCVTYTFDVHDQISLVVVGYISNKNVLVGGGAGITLHGYYKEG